MTSAKNSARPALSIVAPFLDERDNLRPLVRETAAALDGLDLSWELILVDDGSRDGGRRVALAEAERDPRIRVLALDRSYGQSGALWVGLQSCRGDLVATLDADLQNPPGEIPRLVAALDECAVDLVAGIRAGRRDSWARRAASRLANAVRRRALRDPFLDIGCSLRVYRRAVLNGVPCFSTMHRFLPILAIWNGARVHQMEVAHRPRRHGASKYRALRGRALAGVLDLFGMLWLRRRWLAEPRRDTRPATVRTAEDQDGPRPAEPLPFEARRTGLGG